MNDIKWHNPDNVPAEKIPAGWRLLVPEEVGSLPDRSCRLWRRFGYEFTEDYCSSGSSKIVTYITQADRPLPEKSEASRSMTAHDILERAGQHMRDRAAKYDKPEGERSMKRTVAMFNALTGHKLTEVDGWQFMECLKAVRCREGQPRADDFEDRAAYAALAGEARLNEQRSHE